MEAASDVFLAQEWYEERRPGLGAEFVQLLEHTIESPSDFPEAFPEIAAGYRRAILRRLPYFIYYRVDRDGIEVLACLHSSRSPDTWRCRGEA